MTKLRKTMAVLALAGASVAAWEGGTALVENVQYARAEEKVQNSREQLQKVEDLATVFRNVAQAVGPSVVEIQVHKKLPGGRSTGLPNDEFLKKFFRDHNMNPDQEDGGSDNEATPPDDEADAPEQVGTGSGVIIEVDGSDAYIVTNNHVAGGATELTVTLADGREIKGGKTLGADPKSDLAVVKIKADHLIAAKWGDSDQLERGDWVLAFGAPFGYVGSMTHGIVSALNRTNVGILGNQGYENFIQVDAPINPGNSGGPLVNIRGEVVGINTAILSRSGGFQGIGLAIPSDQAKGVCTMLKEKGKVTRGYLGVEIIDVNRAVDEAKAQGFTDDKGVLVKGVLNGTPSAGKLRAGDIITAVDGKNVETSQQLRNQVALIVPGKETTLKVFRDGKTEEVTITIQEQPADMLAAAAGNHGTLSPKAGQSATAPALGMKLSSVSDELATKYDLGNAHDGALVTSVNPRSLAAKAGFQPGDLITRIGNQSITNPQEASDAFAKNDLSKGISVNVVNREGSHFLFIQK